MRDFASVLPESMIINVSVISPLLRMEIKQDLNPADAISNDLTAS